MNDNQLINAKTKAENYGLSLQYDGDSLVLTDGNLSMTGDFTRMLPRLKKNNLQQELLIKAAKIKGQERMLNCIDATAGMGEDSLLLAAAGFSVTLFESDPVIAALLRDTLERSASIPELADAVSRMTLIEGDSISAMPQMDTPDVVVLDPMFPEREKSSLIKKKFQLLQQLESPCADEESLLNAALASHAHKIVIKRPLKGPFLAGRKPSYSLKGKSIRYDVIVQA